MKIDLRVPEGVSGDWKVSHFTVKDSKEEQFWSMVKYGDRAPYPGDYVRLSFQGGTIMSNTTAEVRDHYPFIHRATGHVLIHGLGLGMCVEAVMHKEEVLSITVIELSEDVIKLVAPTYQHPKVQIIQADALKFKPTRKYDVVWHDIWPSINSDNLEEMKKLHRRYGRFARWQGSWARNICEREYREERERETYEKLIRRMHKINL